MEIIQPIINLKAVYIKKKFSRSSRVNETLGYSGFRASELVNKTKTTKMEKQKLKTTLEVLRSVS